VEEVTRLPEIMNTHLKEAGFDPIGQQDDFTHKLTGLLLKLATKAAVEDGLVL
jgi:hypothetical protein